MYPDASLPNDWMSVVSTPLLKLALLRSDEPLSLAFVPLYPVTGGRVRRQHTYRPELQGSACWSLSELRNAEEELEAYAS